MELIALGFSAGIPRGLIEAMIWPTLQVGQTRTGFPRVFPAASLKRARNPIHVRPVTDGCFPRVFPAASLKQGVRRGPAFKVGGFQFPAASLKRRASTLGSPAFSAGIPRGLIEASRTIRSDATLMSGPVFRGYSPRPH